MYKKEADFLVSLIVYYKKNYIFTERPEAMVI